MNKKTIHANVEHFLNICRYLPMSFVLLAAPSLSAEALKLADIKPSIYIFAYPMELSGNWMSYEYATKENVLYRCVNGADRPVSESLCTKSEPPKNTFLHDAIVKRWGAETNGELASFNIFWSHDFLNIPEPYRQDVYTLIFHDKLNKKIWVCRFINNRFEFEASINHRDAFFFSSRPPVSHDFCKLEYPK